MKGEGWRDWHRWEMDRDGALAEILELLGILEILGALEILGILEPLGAGDSKTLEIRDWLEIRHYPQRSKCVCNGRVLPLARSGSCAVARAREIRFKTDR